MVKQEYIADWVLRAQKIARLGIWDQDAITDELWWSDETFRILGLDPQTITPSFDEFLQVVHPDDRALIVKQTALALNFDDNPIMALTKANLIDSVYDQSDFQKQESTSAVETLLEIIKHKLEMGEDVLISGFGKFCVKDKKERKGRNPQTANDIKLRARRIVRFKCSGVLRDRVNG